MRLCPGLSRQPLGAQVRIEQARPLRGRHHVTRATDLVAGDRVESAELRQLLAEGLVLRACSASAALASRSFLWVAPVECTGQ